jgi:membrane protein implicated in regulation of membrane protease activity
VPGGCAYPGRSAWVYTRKWHESRESRWNVSTDGEEDILGKVGRVTVSIPAEGPGEVLLSIRGGTEAFAAWSDEPIRRHRRVVVVEWLSARSVFVTPVS